MSNPDLGETTDDFASLFKDSGRFWTPTYPYDSRLRVVNGGVKKLLILKTYFFPHIEI